MKYKTITITKEELEKDMIHPDYKLGEKINQIAELKHKSVSDILKEILEHINWTKSNYIYTYN